MADQEPLQLICTWEHSVRSLFAANGSLPKPPVRVVENVESWLIFTDLVFIDPIGTGFSRSLPQDKDTQDKSGEKPIRVRCFYQGDRILGSRAGFESPGEFIQRFLSKEALSPIIAGESYGGFRVARLVRKLQQNMSSSGAILISPAMEFSLLGGNDNLTSWATLFPLCCGSRESRSRPMGRKPGDLQAHMAAAEQFARKTLIPLLAMGDTLTPDERQTTYQQMAGLIGLPVTLIETGWTNH